MCDVCCVCVCVWVGGCGCGCEKSGKILLLWCQIKSLKSDGERKRERGGERER